MTHTFYSLAEVERSGISPKVHLLGVSQEYQKPVVHCSEGEDKRRSGSDMFDRTSGCEAQSVLKYLILQIHRRWSVAKLARRSVSQIAR